MHISGKWKVCDDGIRRPLIDGEIQAFDGAWRQGEFLVDTGADKTVFNAELLAKLGFPPRFSEQRLSGVGGVAASMIVETKLALPREDGGNAIFRAQFSAFTELEALDMSVLGRDILGLFALIVDQPGDVVCLLGQQHTYKIEQT